MPPLAVAATTWIQLAGVTIAAIAALASWKAVRLSGAEAEEFREAQREARQPMLLLSPAFPMPAAGPRTMTLGIYNAGDIAIDVGVMLVGEEELARSVVGLMRPGETVNFGSDVPATGKFRALVFARSTDGNRWVWDHNRERRPMPTTTPRGEEWQTIPALFYPGEDFNQFRPAKLLRASDVFG